MTTEIDEAAVRRFIEAVERVRARAASDERSGYPSLDERGRGGGLAREASSSIGGAQKKALPLMVGSFSIHQRPSWRPAISSRRSSSSERLRFRRSNIQQTPTQSVAGWSSESQSLLDTYLRGLVEGGSNSSGQVPWRYRPLPSTRSTSRDTMNFESMYFVDEPSQSNRNDDDEE